MATRLLLALLLLAVAACNNDICARHSDCSHGQTCSADGVCVGTPDAGTETPATDAVVDAAATTDGAP